MRNKFLSFSTIVLILSILVLGSITPAQAAPQSICVSTTGGGAWSSPATWQFCTSGTMPASSDDVYIQGPVSIAAATTAANVSIGNGGSISTGANLLTANNLTIDAGGAFTGGVLVGGNLSENGDFDGSGQPVTVNGTSSIGSGAGLAAGDGTILFKGQLTNSGVFTAGSDTSFAGDVNNQASGTFNCGANTIDLQGNVTNLGTFNASSGTVVFSGSLQNLAAQSATAFNNLTVNSGTTLVESIAADNVTVTGALVNNGVIRKSKSIPATGVYTFGLAGGPVSGASVSINVTSDSFTSITLDRISQNHPSRTGSGAPPASGVGWVRYWHISAIGSGTANVTLPHDAPNGSLTQACRYVAGPGGGWDCSRSSSTANTVTRNGVSSFSDWAVGYQTGPTAVELGLLQGRPAGVGAAGFGSLMGLALVFLMGVILVRKKK